MTLSCLKCNKFVEPSDVKVDGVCPVCGRPLIDLPEPSESDAKVPWHFKVLVGLVVLYLGWRLVQLIVWLL